MLHSIQMASFAKYTHNYNTRLKDTPFYRKGARGPDPLKSFVAKSYVDYTQNAGRIRDMRFAKSNELNKDYALRSKREDMISATYANERDPVKLAGLHGRMRMKLSRTGGALSDGMPQVVKLKAGHYARKYGYTARAGTAKKAVASVGMFTSASNASVAPKPTKTDGGHSAPEAGSGAGALQKASGFKVSRDRQRLGIPDDAMEETIRNYTRSQASQGTPKRKKRRPTSTPDAYQQQQQSFILSPESKTMKRD
jgi:hypothetical protein